MPPRRARTRSRRLARKRRTIRSHVYVGGDAVYDTASSWSDKLNNLASDAIDDSINTVGEWMGVEFTEDDKNNIKTLVNVSLPEIEEAGLDAVGVIPGVGEVVEFARLSGDLLQAGTDAYEEKAAIVSLVSSMSSNKHMYERLKAHHKYQGDLLSRVDKERAKFVQSNNPQQS